MRERGGPQNSDRVLRWNDTPISQGNPHEKTKRNRYSAAFKAKVALEAIKGKQTLSESGNSYGIHPNMIATWKRQAVENMSDVFVNIPGLQLPEPNWLVLDAWRSPRIEGKVQHLAIYRHNLLYF